MLRPGTNRDYLERYSNTQCTVTLTICPSTVLRIKVAREINIDPCVCL